MMTVALSWVAVWYISGIFVYFTGWFLWFTLIHLGRDGFHPYDTLGEITWAMLQSLVWPLTGGLKLLAFVADFIGYRLYSRRKRKP